MTPQMGSRRFPSKGFRKASFFCHLKFGAAYYRESDAGNPVKYVSRLECYDLRISEPPPLHMDSIFITGVLDFLLQYASPDQDKEIYGRNKFSEIYMETTATTLGLLKLKKIVTDLAIY